MTLRDSFALSWTNVKSNKLRTIITVIIMALGIFALILIITSIKAASNSLTDSFSTMGANSFSLRFKDRNIRFGNNNSDDKDRKESKKAARQRKSNYGIRIDHVQAEAFKERYNFPGTKVSVAVRASSGIVANIGSLKTNPDVSVFGADEHYVELNGYNIQHGRNFSITEVNSGSNVCIIGSSVAEKLFPDNYAKAIDAVINVDHIPYRVIAVLEDKGSSAFFNTGRVIITPVNNARRVFSVGNVSYIVAVSVPDLKLMDVAIGEARGVFRNIRGLAVKDEDNFFIDKSDSIAEALLTNLGFLEKGTIGIAFITLIGAAIGLMNIMLVAVNERTKEIGLTKALGGTKMDIRSQFLFESIIISMLGALAGIVAGVLIGNLVAVLLGTGFVVPWGWVLAAIIVCSGVGLAAGLYPAIKASNLDPIVALRYE